MSTLATAQHSGSSGALGSSGPSRRRPRTRLVLGALGMVGVVCLASGCGATAGAATTSDSKSFDAPADRLVIVSDYDLSVRTHAGDSIDVEREVPENWNPTWTLQDDTLELRVRRPGLVFGGNARGEVMVPEGLEVEIRMPNNDLDVTDLADGVTVHNTNGDVRFIDVRGTVEAIATNGDIDVDATEPLDALRVRTKNGDIVARLGGDVAYDVSTDTLNGDVGVEVRREEGADRTIDASTTNGDININSR